MTEPSVTCPQCSTSIPLTESLAAPLIKATRLKYEQAIAAKDRSIAEREASVRERAELLEKERAQFEEQIAHRLEAERLRITAEETAKASRLVATDLQAKVRELIELQQVLRQRDEKLAEAQKAQAEFIRKERALEDEKRELELTVERRVQAQVAAAQQKARAEAEEPLKLRVLEREEQIASMQRQIEELRRKAEQGSQQLQGEVLELELEAMLRSKFPCDVVEPVPKGEFGGDILQEVMGPQNQICGKILWESKRTKTWSHGWLTKLREDQRRAKADVALIVTSALPKGIRGFDLVDGVWIAEPLSAFPLALAIRVMLVELAGARQAKEGQQTKMEMVYDYLMGPYFRQRVGAIVEKVEEMRADLEKERFAMTKIWAKREKQIHGVIEATAGMYGDLQGIAGRALEEIDYFDLQLIGEEGEQKV